MDQNVFQIYPSINLSPKGLYYDSYDAPSDTLFVYPVIPDLDPTASERMSGNDIFRDKNIVWQVRSAGPLLDNIWAGGNVKH